MCYLDLYVMPLTYVAVPCGSHKIRGIVISKRAGMLIHRQHISECFDGGRWIRGKSKDDLNGRELISCIDGI